MQQQVESGSIDEMYDSDAPATLEQARAIYYDALIAFDESSDQGVAPTENDERNLELARDKFNVARSAAGILSIE